MGEEAVLRVKKLTKRFAEFTAVDAVSIDFYAGEIHAIIGENGAGKSTICKMISGSYTPDEGEIILNGKEACFKGTAEAINAGIGMLYQERNLIPTLTGAQNICLGCEPKHGLMMNEKGIIKIAKELKEKLGINVPLEKPIGDLGAGMQQTIEIMRALRTNPQILILDEPTASLGEGEIEPFLKFVVELSKQSNIAIIYISHKLEEIFKISSRISVLTDGVKTLEAKTADIHPGKVVSAMLREKKIQNVTVSNSAKINEEALLKSKGAFYDGKNHSVPFSLHKGEAIGFYGLVGSGRTEWAEVLFGLRPAKKFDFIYKGKKIDKIDTHKMIKDGVILTPEKRAHGIFRNGTLIFNITTLFLDKLSTQKMGILKFKKMKKFGEEVLRKHGVKHTDSQQTIAELSGGNIQKIITGRSIELDDVELLIFDEPTIGIDLGAKHEIYIKIRELVESEKKGVIFISSELEELIAVCDRICVFADGNMIAEAVRESFNKQQILDSAIRGKASGETMKEVG